jgi:hypothetical protein
VTILGLGVQRRTREVNRAIIESMPTGTTFNAPTAKGRSRAIKIRDGTDVAARYFVYKLYEATSGQPMQWQVLLGVGNSAATISRAVEDGSFSRKWAATLSWRNYSGPGAVDAAFNGAAAWP